MIDLPVFLSANMLTVAGVFIVLSVIISYFLFRNTMVEGDFERVLEFTDKRRGFDFKYIGIDKFWNTPMKGEPSAISNSRGQPQYVIENRDDDGTIHFAWVCLTSNLEFMRKKHINKVLRKKYEKELRANLVLRPLVRVAGAEIGKSGIEAIEKALDKRTLSLDPQDVATVKKVRKEIQEILDPDFDGEEDVIIPPKEVFDDVEENPT